MKPAPFAYHAPTSLPELLELTGRYAANGRVLAGGQSLMPLLNMRRVRTEHLVDLGGVAELDYVRPDDGAIAVGAGARQGDVLVAEAVTTRTPILAEALRHVASPTVRNRGTVCGSIAFALPGAELPAVALAVGGEVVAEHAGGARRIDVGEFFVAPFVTALRPGEIVKELRLSRWPEAAGHAFVEVSRLGWPVVGAAVVVELADGLVSRCSVALAGVSGVPVRAGHVERAVTGTVADEAVIREASEHSTEGLEVRGSVHGPPDYHRHVASVLVRRGLSMAVERAREAAS